MRKTLRRSTIHAFVLLVTVSFSFVSRSANASGILLYNLSLSDVKDSIPVSDTTTQDTVSYHLTGLSSLSASLASFSSDTMDLESSVKYPALALQQHLKGNLRGLFVQSSSMAPGAKQHMFIRGVAKPLLSKKDLYDVQPAIFLNGIPLILDHPFVYNIQKYQFKPIGPATNLLSAIDIDNISSIKILKGPEALALLGPRAANGAIVISTKNAEAGHKKIEVNGYAGVVPAYDPDPVNAAYIAKVRQPFYDKYATPAEIADYPEFLANTSDPNYYGPANWTDLYYRDAFIHSVNGSLTGGTERANFRFFGGESQSNSGIDGQKLNRYTSSFFINMLPLPWLTVATMIHATRLERTRNTGLRDRFAEMNYLPDLTYPLAPNKDLYGEYLRQYDLNSFDKNRNNLISGSFSLEADLNKWLISSQIAIDYNEAARDLFWPSTLLEGNNYVSNYYGENRRFIIKNAVRFTDTIGRNSFLTLEGGQSLQSDLHSYNYGYAYKGPSDYIKVNVVDGNEDHADYLEPKGFIAYRYLDRIKSHLVSFYGNVNYSYKNLVSLSTVVRSDGSSFAQPSSRWFISPAVSVRWNLKHQFITGASILNNLYLKVSWGRIGRLFPNAMIGSGPEYRTDLGWKGAPRMSSYNGIATLTRPYSYGWVGYDIKWPYSETRSISLNAGMFDKRLNIDLTLYNKDDKRMILGVPSMAASGYSKNFEQGMWVNNKGIEVGLSGEIIKSDLTRFYWTLDVQASANKNTLKALPGDLNEMIIGDQKLMVGKPVDQFWLLRNEGIYASDTEVPVNPATQSAMTYNGIALKGGDAKWMDVNGDYLIDNKDKSLIGHRLPIAVGGVNNNLRWRGLSFSFNFYFALGQNILNTQAAKRLDFVNVSSANDMQSVFLNEITFWQRTFDPSRFPNYNPWSETKPFQTDQDLFLEDGSYVKLRRVTLGYDLTKARFFNKWAPSFTKMLFYVSANNLVTFTNYSGMDPEVITYRGVNNGYGVPLLKSFTVGLKIDF